MTLYIKRAADPTAFASTAADLSFALAEIKGTERLVPLDGGATFVAAVIYVVGEFAKGLGEGIGKSIGASLFGGGSKQEIKAILDFYTQYVLDAIRQEFYLERWREVHERAAEAGDQMNQVLLDPAQRTVDNMTRIAAVVHGSYSSLRNLGPGAFADQARMGAAVMGCAVLLAQATGAKTTWQAAAIRVDEVMEDLNKTMSEIEQAYGRRVIGPHEAMGRDYCYVPGYEPSPKTILPARRVPGYHYQIDVPCYEVVIDGQAHRFSRRRPDPCKSDADLSASAMASAGAFATDNRTRIYGEYEDKFAGPFAIIRQKADELSESIRRKH